MPDVSRIPEVVDASAAIAAAYIPGVKSVFGAGSGLVTIPAGGVMAGQPVPAWRGNIVEPGTHVSVVTTFTKADRSGTVAEIPWRIEMRYYVARNDLAIAYMQLAAIAPLYFAAFSQHVHMLGTISSGSALIIGGGLVVPSSQDDAWIAFYLNAMERLDLANKA